MKVSRITVWWSAGIKCDAQQVYSVVGLEYSGQQAYSVGSAGLECGGC